MGGADGEIGRRVELESKLVTKDEEIAFLKRVYEEKLRMALDFDLDSEASYSNDLAEALKDIRAEYQAQLEASRGGEDDAWFQQKISVMMATSDKQRGELQMSRDELAKAKAKYQELVTSTSGHSGQLAALRAQIADLTADFENQKKIHAVALADRDAQVAEYKKQIAAYILELKGLMDIKLSLDEEIGTYRRLLLAGGSEIKVGGGGGAVVVGGGSSVTSSTVVELKVETLEQLYKDFRIKYEAELSAHESTRARLPKLEKEISEKDAQIDFLAKTLSGLEPQVAALKLQISTYQKEAIEAKMGADGEIGRRVELESKLVTKDEEIAFLKR